MDFHDPRNPLEQEREGVREDDIASFIPWSGFQRLLQIIFIRRDELAPKVEGELVEAGGVEVDEGKDLEKPLDGGQIFGMHSLVEPSINYSTNLTNRKV